MPIKQQQHWRHRLLLVLLVLAAAAGAQAAGIGPVTLAPVPQPQEFHPRNDLRQQHQALLQILYAVGNGSELVAPQNSTLPALGYGGNSSWGTAGVSYCHWWGVTCCGTALTSEVSVCSHTHSVSALELAALGLAGVLPDVFAQLPDLQVFDVSYNRGVS